MGNLLFADVGVRENLSEQLHLTVLALLMKVPNTKAAQHDGGGHATMIAARAVFYVQAARKF